MNPPGRAPTGARRQHDGPGTLLTALRTRSPDEPAISPDGRSWLNVADLIERARRAAGTAHAQAPRVRLVPGHDPVQAVVTLLAAELTAAVPVVAGHLAATDGSPGSGDTSVAAPVPQGPRAASLARVLQLAAQLPDEQPLLVVVTSGSTAAPRAVVRTAASWQRALPGYDLLLGERAGSGSVTWVPGGPASTLTLFGLWHALATGRPVIASGAWRPADAAAVGARAVSVQCVPTVLADVLADVEAGRLHRLRTAVVAGAAVPDRLRARAEHAGVRLAEYYGAAELSFVAADVDGTGLRAFPGAELAVQDGLILVRSPYLALGYLEPDPDGALRTEPGGWAGVGDRGRLAPGGRLIVSGRGAATASVGGHTVALDDVEAALRDQPGVAELVCLAQPHPRWGEQVVAVVRPTTDAAARTELVAALRRTARHCLPSPARPVRYLLRAELPRTPGGKVARAQLLAQVLSPDAPRTLAP